MTLIYAPKIECADGYYIRHLKMPTRTFRDVTQEEQNFALGFGMAIAHEDELLAHVAQMNVDGCEAVKTKVKKMMVVYKVLKNRDRIITSFFLNSLLMFQLLNARMQNP
jgi:hypothetical protein